MAKCPPCTRNSSGLKSTVGETKAWLSPPTLARRVDSMLFVLPPNPWMTTIRGTVITLSNLKKKPTTHLKRAEEKLPCLCNYHRDGPSLALATHLGPQQYASNRQDHLKQCLNILPFATGPRHPAAHQRPSKNCTTFPQTERAPDMGDGGPYLQEPRPAACPECAGAQSWICSNPRRIWAQITHGDAA